MLEAYQDSLKELFPGRDEVPKTLIFAKDDAHAEEIVRIAREVFGKGDEFCKKITYRATADPEDLIAAFRNSYFPRIAVTVDMIATGTDVKPLEALLFMRAVKSRVLFEQMLGRGTRIVSDTDFRAVTQAPQARKSYFVIVDAVGITEQELIETQTTERKKSAPLKALIDAVAVGAADEDVLASLARRLGLMEKRLSENQRQEVDRLLDVPAAPERFHSLRDLANAMLDALDPDCVYSVGARRVDSIPPGESSLASPLLEAARRELVQRALIPLAANPDLRAFLLEREILIDETSVDEVVAKGFDSDATARARQLVESFQAFIQENRDEITALQILFNRPYAQRHLDFPQVRELAERLNAALQQGDPLYMTEALWRAYTQLEKDRVRGAGERRVLADLVSLVRHAALDEDLVPYPDKVQQRYHEWLAGRGDLEGRPSFTPQQRWWLDEIARHIGINVSISVEDLNSFAFQPRGGQVAALKMFGDKLPALLEEINQALSV